MDENLARALIAAARAFADELERVQTPGSGSAMEAGTEHSMFRVLESVAEINDAQSRGVSDREIREIAKSAGMDPRGMAGYYAAKLLEKRTDGTRWLSAGGRERLRALTKALALDGSGPLTHGSGGV